MTAVILAAGTASRLRPLTDNLPKPLLQIGQHALLKRMLDALAQNGFDDYVIVTGFCADQIVSFVNHHFPALRAAFVHNPAYATTSNSYSLWLAGLHVRGKPFLLLDGDILFPPQLLARLCDDPHQNALIVRKSTAVGEEEVKVQLDLQGNVCAIGKEISKTVTAGESLGIEKFSSHASTDLFRILDRRKGLGDFYEASFQEMIDGGLHIHAVDTDGFACMEIDTPADLVMAQELVATHRV